ncbi:PAS domain S-box-containing protein/diguanylate cyclase (GGDEF)-like protein [Idiomarina fontislapidosi]|nr:EAL domain-containing protein [Idiomarina fontislapidosi]PYE35302.1 PAS domain S-box-containing protein/diguanylate cyclase (GGDEF)-like protein [Idiomarina fontislapidosi]
MRVSIITLVCLVFALATFSPYCVSHDTPHSTAQLNAPIIDIEAGPLGFLWIATPQAIYRFDGSSLRKVKLPRLSTSQLPTDVHCLTNRQDQALLIGSSIGILALPFKSAELEASLLLQSKHLLDSGIQHITSITGSPLVAQNENSLLIQHQDELLPQPLQYDDEPVQNIRFIKSVGDWIWLAEGQEIYVWDGLGSNLFKLTIENPVTEQLPQGQLIDIERTDEGLFLLYRQTLVQLDNRYRLVNQLSLDTLDISGAPLELNKLPSGKLALLASNQLYQLQKRSDGAFELNALNNNRHINPPWRQHYVEGGFSVLINQRGQLEVVEAPGQTPNALWLNTQPTNSGTVYIDYSLPAFNQAKPQAFEYRIEPLQQEWQKTLQPLQKIKVSNLSDGQFTLSVRALSLEQGEWINSQQTFVMRSTGFSSLQVGLIIFALLSVALTLGYLMFTAKLRSFNKLERANASLHRLLEGTQQQLWTWRVNENEVERTYIWPNCSQFPLDGVRFGIGQHEDSNIHPDDIRQLSQTLAHVKDGKLRQYQCTYRLKNGTQWVWVLERGEVAEEDAEGAPRAIHGVLSDISDIINSDERIDMLATSLTNISDGICIFDRFFRKREINNAYERITGYERSQVIGQAFALPHYDRDFTDQIKHTVLRQGRWSGEVTDFKADGSELLLELTFDAVRSDNGDIKLIVASFSDITERRNTENELRRLSNTDSLTGLPNRSYFQVSHSNLVRKRVSHALLLFDLDDFKRINDSLGHEVGDELLCRVADRLADLGRRQDTLYRLGGDEFGILVEDNTDINVISTIAQQVNAEIAKPYNVKGHEIALGSSIGIVLYPHDAHTSQELLQKADTAMYHAKQRGGNCYQFFNAPMNENAIQRLVLESQVRHAIRNEQVEVFYQPKMEIATGHISGIEALARIRDEYGQFISPSQFIPLCEDTGLIIPLSEQVLRQACRDMRNLLALQGSPRSVAINLSARQFTQSSLALFIEQVLQEEQMHPRHIEFEITEGMVMSDPERAIAMLENLADMGVQLALDDFGTGYSSLSYLKRFPMHTLKIDKEFIDDITFDERDRKMVESIIGMAHNLGLKVVAEGVEQKAQLDILRRLQCEYIQGYYFAKPMSAEALIEFIAKQQLAYS